MELSGISELNKLGNSESNKVYGTNTGKYLTIASIDIETNSLQVTTGDILSFGYNKCKFYYTKDKPNELAKPIAGDNYIVGLEVCEKDELFFFHSDLKDAGRTDIHGITLDMVREHASEFVTNLSKMAAICTSYMTLTKNGWAFDMPFIASYLMRFSVPIDADNINMIEEQDIISPVWKIKTGAEGRRKGTLSQHVEWLNSYADENEKFEFKAHNAVEDSLATAWCFYRFMKGCYI